MSDIKPACGTQAVSHDDILTTLLAIGGVVGTIVGIPAAYAAIKTGLSSILLTLGGVAVPASAALAAVAGGLAVFVTVIVFLIDRCYPIDGARTCWAGVVNQIEESFSSASEWIFPFSAMHDRVDVVVKCNYWHLVANNAEYVKCGGDSRRSPILQSFYHSDEVCGAATGALYGAAVGAAAGIITGALVAAAIIAAVGCATIIFCLLALLLAAVIAAVAALIGAFAGGMIGKAAAGDSEPTGSGAGGSQALSVGHYVTVTGNLIVHGGFDGAVVAWWAEGTTLHGGPSANGEGPGGGAPYPHTDPDANLIPDSCPVRSDEIH